MPDFDMEMTEGRANYIKNLLATLYADQIGMEIKSINFKPANKGPEKTASIETEELV